jgi:uncharacterized protein YlzI (FlbEa/FlbD family)
MPHLLHLTRALSPNGETESGTELTINSFHIMVIEDTHPREPGNSKIWMSNGKIFFVEENQDQIRDLATPSTGLL